MKALLDTHAALFAWIAPDRLSSSAREALEDPANQLFLSQVSVLEITLKHRIGKLALPGSPEHYLPSRIQRFNFSYVPLEDADIFGMLDLPVAHRDPFDWLLLATAKRLHLPIISRDTWFHAYPVERIW